MPFAATASGRARKAFRLALNEFGRETVKFIRDSINVKVGFVRGPRGGIAAIIRSVEGESPRREVNPPDHEDYFEHPGLLWRSIFYKVGAGAQNTSALTVDCSAEYGPTLEYVMNRPFMHPGFQHLKSSLRSDFDNVYAAKLGEVNAGAESGPDFTADFPAGD